MLILLPTDTVLVVFEIPLVLFVPLPSLFLPLPPYLCLFYGHEYFLADLSNRLSEGREYLTYLRMLSCAYLACYFAQVFIP